MQCRAAMRWASSQMSSEDEAYEDGWLFSPPMNTTARTSPISATRGNAPTDGKPTPEFLSSRLGLLASGKLVALPTYPT